MDYIVNVIQAKSIMEDAQRRRSRYDSKINSECIDEEAVTVNTAILNAAATGQSSCSCWLMFTVTYNALVERGFLVFGGRIKDKLPAEEQKAWGTKQDLVTISWGP